MRGATTPKHALLQSVSPWHYLPHVAGVTLATVVLPLAAVELAQSLAGIRSVALSIPLAIALSVVVATAGSSLWKRRPGARDMLFGDLMLVGFARRLWTERNLAEARRIVGDARSSIDQGGEAPPRAVQIQTLEKLARGLDARDPYTHGHSQRVAQNAHLIASRMGLPAGEVAKVRVAAAVHDAGKINIAREILNKPGRLTDDEFEVIKRHPVDGAEMIAPLRDPEVIAMVRHHHERLDGSGYPDGLASTDSVSGGRGGSTGDSGTGNSGNGNGNSGSGHSGQGHSGSGNSGSGNSGSGGSGGNSGSSGSGSGGGLTDLLDTLLNPVLQSPAVSPIITLPGRRRH